MQALILCEETGPVGLIQQLPFYIPSHHETYSLVYTRIRICTESRTKERSLVYVRIRNTESGNFFIIRIMTVVVIGVVISTVSTFHRPHSVHIFSGGGGARRDE